MAAISNDTARAGLLRFALAALEEDGHEALSVRRIAERAGVSSGAPYFHFADRRALLIALALEGFRLLNGRAREGMDGSHAGPRQLLHGLAGVFIDFSAEHPRLVDLMYESEITRPVDEALKPVYREGFALVEAAIERAHQGAERVGLSVRAASFWASLFGLSRLLRHKLLDPFSDLDVGDWKAAILDEIVTMAMAPLAPQGGRPGN
jgi:AcrR family transcriptional regulator